jgi:hypothetical protein
MAAEQPTSAKPRMPRLSLDVWALIAAFLLAVFVRAGVLKHIPW